jgi:Uma2 family endonuclease
MGMSTPRAPYTVAQLDDMPDDGRRYEIIDGELFVTPAPSGRHQDAVLELAALLRAYARSCSLHVRIAPTDVRFSDSTLVQPDLIVLPLMPDGRRPVTFADVGRLVLAVEVLSPGTAPYDRGEKRALYQREAVAEYWIVDLDARAVERWRPRADAAERCDGRMSWQPSSEHAALGISWPDYFRVVCDD